MTTQRRQVVILSSLVPVLTLPAIVLLPQMHGMALRVFVVCYALAMTALFTYVVLQMVKMKRRAR